MANSLPKKALEDTLKALLASVDRVIQRPHVPNTRPGLVLGGQVTAMVAVAGVPLAALLFRTDLPGRSFAIATLLVFACLPVFTTGTTVLSAIGISSYRGSVLAAGLTYGLILTPLAILVVGPGLWDVDHSHEEAALLETHPINVLRSRPAPALQHSTGDVIRPRKTKINLVRVSAGLVSIR